MVSFPEPKFIHNNCPELATILENYYVQNIHSKCNNNEGINASTDTLLLEGVNDLALWPLLGV